MAGKVTGTFAATGDSAPAHGRKIAIHAEFAGVATVSVEWSKGPTPAWVTMRREDGSAYTFTGSFSLLYEGPTSAIRLTCSAYTNDVTYELDAE